MMKLFIGCRDDTYGDVTIFSQKMDKRVKKQRSRWSDSQGLSHYARITLRVLLCPLLVTNCLAKQWADVLFFLLSAAPCCFYLLLQCFWCFWWWSGKLRSPHYRPYVKVHWMRASNEKEKFSTTPPSKSKPLILVKITETTGDSAVPAWKPFNPIRPIQVPSSHLLWVLPMWWVSPHALSFKASSRQCLAV